MAYRFLQEIYTPNVNNLATVAVAAGGTGYAVNDVLTLVGGTGTAAQVRVTTVAAGVITGVTKISGGAYTVNPGSPNSPTGGSGTGASLTVTFVVERGYLKAQKAMMDLLTLGHVLDLSLVSGGTGYTVGDILTLNASGAVGIATCRVEVLAVAAGVITQWAMRSSGAFSILPNFTSASHPTTGGSGTGATFQVTDVEASYAAAVASGGNGYAVGNIITVSGGTLHAGDPAPQFLVTAVSGGVVTALRPYRSTRYDVMPTNPAATTGGAGTGLTVNLSRFSWTHPGATSENYVDNVTNFSFWLRGVNAAGGDPFIGVRSIQFGTARQWGFKCATSFNPLTTFELQPNASPGDYTAPGSSGGQRIPSTEAAVTLFLSWSARVVNGVSRTAPTYEHFHLGLFLPFIDSPATKYPFPLICAGTTRSDTVDINTAFNGRGVNNENTMHASILHHGESAAGTTGGPHMLRDIVGAWRPFEVEQATDGNFAIWPLSEGPGSSTTGLAPNIRTGSGLVDLASPNDLAIDGDASGGDSVNPFNSNTGLNPTPFGPGGQNLYYMVTPLIYQTDAGSPMQLYGELEGVYAINGRGLASEDRISDAAGVRYFVFTDTLSNENRNFIALREG